MSSHTTRFYQNDVLICRSVAEYAASALRSDRAAVLILVPAHRKSILQLLQEQGLPVLKLQTTGALTVLDAQECLNRLMTDGGPDPRKYSGRCGRAD